MSNASAHAVTLNALDEMQQSFAYAARRSVLASAEQIIAQQESQLSEARAAEQVALAETLVYRTMVDSLRERNAALLSIIETVHDRLASMDWPAGDNTMAHLTAALFRERGK